VVHNSKKTWLLALILTLLPSVVGAAGLGRLNVLSALGQPLVGELVSVTREELGSLSARIASADAYQQANLQYNPALVGARVTVERRPNGQHFLKIISSRPVTEPFIDVLVELTWASGRLSREYTALLDPPGVGPAPAPVIAAVPESRPTPAPREQPAAVPAPSRPVAPAAPKAGAREYGPVQRGETLGKIAKEVMPEGVTLEQMLVALYRNNPDAFISKNLNLVRTGKILRVPEKEEIASIATGEAATEYRTHVSDWNGYRQKVADAAGTVPAEGRTAVSGKITAKVEDKGKGGEPKDVVRLSKSEATGAPKGKPGNTAERIRSLEEEVVVREKALNEANERISQLEKTIKDMQKLVELKSPGMASAQQQAQQQAAAPKPDAKPAAKPEPEARKPGAPAPAVKPEAAKPAEASKPDIAAAPADKPMAEQPDAKKAEQPAPAAKPQPAEKPKSKPAPKPAPKAKEPELMDQVMDAVTDPLYLGVGGGVLVLGGLAFWLARRRRRQADGGDEPQIAPRLGKAGDAGAGAAVAAGAAAAQESASAQAAAGEDVDPLAEAEVYIAYGRDGQAEEILKEALAKNPQREDVQLKLLEIYSARKDKAAFAKLAEGLHKQTGGAGDNWIKAAAMGYALDPGNKLYEAGKDAVAAVAGAGAATDIDLDLGLGDAGTATDITLDAGAAGAAAGTDTGILDLGQPSPEQATPDFSLEVPAAGGEAADAAPVTAAAPVQDDAGVLDFQIELPKAADEPATQATPPAAAAAPSTDGGLDFKLDDLNLNLDQPKTETAAAGEKDGHWYDVQTKFDLAKAYQEMGDKDGAKEILQEVMKEGDAEQKAQAKNLMDSLG
jgi:pilus assembly protein FimV